MVASCRRAGLRAAAGLVVWSPIPPGLGMVLSVVPATVRRRPSSPRGRKDAAERKGSRTWSPMRTRPRRRARSTARRSSPARSGWSAGRSSGPVTPVCCPRRGTPAAGCPNQLEQVRGAAASVLARYADRTPARGRPLRPAARRPPGPGRPRRRRRGASRGRPPRGRRRLHDLPRHLQPGRPDRDRRPVRRAGHRGHHGPYLVDRGFGRVRRGPRAAGVDPRRARYGPGRARRDPRPVRPPRPGRHRRPGRRRGAGRPDPGRPAAHRRPGRRPARRRASSRRRARRTRRADRHPVLDQAGRVSRHRAGPALPDQGRRRPARPPRHRLGAGPRDREEANGPRCWRCSAAAAPPGPG